MRLWRTAATMAVSTAVVLGLSAGSAPAAPLNAATTTVVATDRVAQETTGSSTAGSVAAPACWVSGSGTRQASGYCDRTVTWWRMEAGCTNGDWLRTGWYRGGQTGYLVCQTGSTVISAVIYM